MTRALLLVLALLATGCRFGGVPAPEPLAAALERDSLLRDRGRSATPLRLAVAPVRTPSASKPNPLEPARHPAVPAAESVRQDLVGVLRAAGMFGSVEPRGTGDMTPGQVLDAAASENADLVLELSVRSYGQEYLGHSNYVGWFLLYVGYIVPGWYFPVDYYGVSIEAHATLRGLQSPEPLLEETYTISAADSLQELTPDNRGLVGFIDLGALWSVEESLSEANWSAIDAQVSPHAWRRLHLALLRDIETRVIGPIARGSAAERERVLAHTRKRFGVVVGVGGYADPELGLDAAAVKDASAFSTLLASPRGGGAVAGRTLTLLTDKAATRGALLSTVAAVASAASPIDEVTLYVAARGTTLALPDREGAPALFAQDSIAAVPSSALLLDELGDALEAIRAERVLVILDLSFGGPAAPSRAHRPPNDPGRAPTSAALERALVRRPGIVLLAAGQPGQAAIELDDGEGSVFGKLVRLGIEGAADADRDGRVRLSELVGFLDQEVPSRAALEGFEQRPFTAGADGVELAWPR